jgi:D-lactate dehydrogenase
MKKGVIFINTARGTVVNTEDLIDALKVDISDSRFRRLWKEKTSSLVTITKKKGSFIHYTSLLPNVLITGQGFWPTKH